MALLLKLNSFATPNFWVRKKKSALPCDVHQSFLLSLASTCGLSDKIKVGIRGFTVDARNFCAAFATLDRENQYPFLSFEPAHIKPAKNQVRGQVGTRECGCSDFLRMTMGMFGVSKNPPLTMWNEESENSGKHPLPKGGIVFSCVPSTFLFTCINAWKSFQCHFMSPAIASSATSYRHLKVKSQHCNGIQLALLT